MGETANIAEIATQVAKEIFRPFRWHMHPQRDQNILCVNDQHRTQGGKPKKTHPGDVVFSYEDPYLGKSIFLHTDLKSYAEDTIDARNIRKALKSLALTIECAQQSQEWRDKYGAHEPHEVRGLLFVHNHDNKFEQAFDQIVRKIDPHSIITTAGITLNFLGPTDINRLLTTANDIRGLRAEQELPDDYTFYYPDLVMRRRQGDVWAQAATVESLSGPFLLLKHRATQNCGPGYVVYYNRPGARVEEFEYFLDCLSRFQMLDSDEKIRIRMVDRNAAHDLKSIFQAAATRYARSWGFEPSREKILRSIEVERVPYVASNYNPGTIGWRP